ncbi:hypothetical protein [Nocardiopsis synnemataformans]|uniref:hypothetical protein n=1 Tax=Nocardiopsis synnemataformans TaxID=61305 RepID=UPI003EBC9B90
MLELEQVPTSPGIYAWYVSFHAGPQDWKTRPVGDEDSSVQGFLRLLREYASYYDPPPIELKGSAAYGGAWDGSLELDRGMADPESHTVGDRDDQHSKDHAALADSVSSEKGRKILSEMLSRITPVFSAPLYIGVADNLRARLLQHRKSYSKSMQWLRENPHHTERLRVDAKNFGQRAASRGISMEHLEAWVIDVSTEESSSDSDLTRASTQSAEWFLHRAFSPILGKR